MTKEDLIQFLNQREHKDDAMRRLRAAYMPLPDAVLAEMDLDYGDLLNAVARIYWAVNTAGRLQWSHGREDVRAGALLAVLKMAHQIAEEVLSVETDELGDEAREVGDDEKED